MNRQDPYIADSHSGGFTLIELLVAMIITALMTGVILNFMLDYWAGTGTLANDQATFVERENAGDRLRGVLNAAAKLANQNSITDPNATVPDPGDSTRTHWLLIHAIPGTITMPAAGSYTPVFYYEAPSVNASKQYIMNGAQRYLDEFVLYLSGSTKQLLLRNLANPGATGNIVKTTCPPASATSTCPADTAISGDISSVSVSYYSKSGNTIDYTSSTDPNTGLYNGPDFPTVEVVQLILHYGRASTINGGAASLNQAVVRVALRN